MEDIVLEMNKNSDTADVKILAISAQCTYDTINPANKENAEYIIIKIIYKQKEAKRTGLFPMNVLLFSSELMDIEPGKSYRICFNSKGLSYEILSLMQI